MGQTFGRYEVLKRIGRGGMAEVFHARFSAAPGVTKDVVLKRILPAYAEHQEFRQMFLAEARLSMKLSHGNVVQVFDAGEVDGALFLAMEWIDGVGLDDVLARAVNRDLRGLPPVVAALIIIEVLKGLHHAHTRKDDLGRPLQLVHRDVSPDNVLVSYEGEVKVTDFGIAKARMAGRELTEPGVFKGKFSYGAPEQARGEQVDARADIYSTGIVLYELVAGKNPAGSTEVAKAVGAGARVLPRFPVELADPEFVTIVTRALSPGPGDRYATAQMFQQALMQWCATRAGVHAASGVGHTMRWLFSEELQRRQPGVPLGAQAESFLELVGTRKVLRPSSEAPTREGLPKFAAEPALSQEPPTLAPPPESEGFSLAHVKAIGVAGSIFLAGVGLWYRSTQTEPPPPEVANAKALKDAMRRPLRPLSPLMDNELVDPTTIDAGRVLLNPSVFEVQGAPASFKLTDAHLLFLDSSPFVEWSPGATVKLLAQPVAKGPAIVGGPLPVFSFQRVDDHGLLTRLMPGKAEGLLGRAGSVQLFAPSFDFGPTSADLVDGRVDVSGKVMPLSKTALQWVKRERRVTVEGLAAKKSYLLTLAPVKEGGRSMPVLVGVQGEGKSKATVGGFERVGVLSSGEHLVSGARTLMLAIPMLSGVDQEEVKVTLVPVEEPVAAVPAAKAPRVGKAGSPGRSGLPAISAQVPEARQWFDAATRAMASGQLPAAREAMVKGLRLEPRNANAHYVAGVLAQRQGDPKEALFQFQLFLKLAPEGHPNWNEAAALVAKLESQR